MKTSFLFPPFLPDLNADFPVCSPAPDAGGHACIYYITSIRMHACIILYQGTCSFVCLTRMQTFPFALPPRTLAGMHGPAAHVAAALLAELRAGVAAHEVCVCVCECVCLCVCV